MPDNTQNDPIIFKTNGKEGFRIPYPTTHLLGTKCPEMKLEIKMTESISGTIKYFIEELEAELVSISYQLIDETNTDTREQLNMEYQDLEQRLTNMKIIQELILKNIK
jgi:hypothetical protein